MKFFLLALLFFAPNLAFAENIIFCDPGDPTVPNRVEHYIPSAHTPRYRSQNILKNADLSAVAGVARMYWKCQGRFVVAMTSEERSALRTALVGRNIFDCTPTTRGRTRIFLAPDGAGADQLQGCMRNPAGVLSWRIFLPREE